MITSAEMSVDEALDTLTGYEEQAIEKRFGFPYEVLLVRKPTTALRAVMFALITRDLNSQDVKDPEGKSYRHVMERSVKDVTDFFPEPPAEENPDLPVSESGKDGQVAEPQL